MTSTTHSNPDQSQLGKTSQYSDHYDASLLFPISRVIKRAELGILTSPVFFGADLWTAYEVGWLNSKGKPQIALAHIVIPADSPNIIESKSLKLYLNSFNNTQLEGIDHGLNALMELLNHDLSDAAGIKVSVCIEKFPLSKERNTRPNIIFFEGISLDRLDIECQQYLPAPELLKTLDELPIEETVYSDLLKSNCLVTGQPDWGSVSISYVGVPICHVGLLQYIVSLRNHNEFHEHCVERIFMDIWQRCKPARLTVYARYTRRGGLDINPYRTSTPNVLPKNIRLARQ
ncbi:MAG: NADPH-dependent 7-cyano-7-deazaguanine reductase [Pseudomonadota bacterium]|jgi:7-cyano-7-deazaguanine reductase